MQEWIAGGKPNQLTTISIEERRFVRHLFRQQALQHKNYWRHISIPSAREFWKRARYDAHATFRNEI